MERFKDHDFIITGCTIVVVIVYILVLAYWNFGPQRAQLKNNLCLQEINKLYISTENALTQTIYKIEKIEGEKYFLKAFKNGMWTYIGTKPLNYFDEGDIFRFENIVCPDISDYELQKKDPPNDDFEFIPK